MPIITLKTSINAPIEKVFDLSRSIDFHKESQRNHNEIPLAGTITGLINLGETVTWRAKHFGITQQLTTKITAYSYPVHFRDSQISGIFKYFHHDHFFMRSGEKTIMKDIFEYESPFGILGKIADTLYLKKYMSNFLLDRNILIKEMCESTVIDKYIS